MNVMILQKYIAYIIMIIYRSIMFLSRVIRSYGSIIIALISALNRKNYAFKGSIKITVPSVGKRNNYSSLWEHNKYSSERKYKNYVSIMLLFEIVQTL